MVLLYIWFYYWYIRFYCLYALPFINRRRPP